MAYIGRGTENISNVEVLDNLTFDGSASYTLQKSSTNFVPSSANNLLISISGVVQQGNFSVSGSTITFDTTVASSDTCDWILHYGTGLITTPADGTVSNDKIAYPLVKSGATVSTFNRTSSTGDIVEFQKDGTEVGVIGTVSSNLYVGSGDTGIYFNNSEDRVYPINTTTVAGRDNAIDLGKSDTRWKDFYLGGNIYLGGTTSANALDDYEEGTFTATFTGTSDTSTGYYRKIGTIVFVQVYSSAINVTSSVNAEIGGLPFNAIDYAVGAITHNTYATGSENGYFNTSNNKLVILNEDSVGVAGTIVGNPKYVMMSGCYVTN